MTIEETRLDILRLAQALLDHPACADDLVEEAKIIEAYVAGDSSAKPAIRDDGDEVFMGSTTIQRSDR